MGDFDGDYYGDYNTQDEEEEDVVEEADVDVFCSQSIELQIQHLRYLSPFAVCIRNRAVDTIVAYKRSNNISYGYI